MQIKSFLLLLTLVFCLLKVDRIYANDKKIAITIDDAPMVSSQLFSGIERTKKIINSLDEPAGIFVIGENILNNSGKEHLKLYDEAGHIIGNHTYSHYSCRKVSAEKFITDIEKADSLLKNCKNFKKIFRYPYLDQCKAKEKKAKVSKYLEDKGYINGYVTIVTLDWHMNNLLQKALKKGKKINYSKLKELYLETMIGYVHFYHKVYIEKLGFSPPHSLLLHENDLNALYLRDLIALLKDNGWDIILPQDVYKDERVVDNVNKARKNLPNIDTLKPAYIDKLFNEVTVE